MSNVFRRPFLKYAGGKVAHAAAQVSTGVMRWSDPVSLPQWELMLKVSVLVVVVVGVGVEWELVANTSEQNNLCDRLYRKKKKGRRRGDPGSSALFPRNVQAVLVF